MATALGIYIENNLIKYSKVTSNRDKLNIDAYGVKYTTNISNTIEQIIKETDSLKIPIVVNSVDQEIHYFDIFSQLNEKDYVKSIELQFEEITTESAVNKNLFKTGYLISKKPKDPEKLHVLHMSQYITAMDTRANLFIGNKPTAQMPMSVAITNLSKDVSPYLVLNLEEKTELTAVLEKKVYEVKTFRGNIISIINQINSVENSISKSYDVLKNTVVPISESDKINMEENEYIPMILVEFNQIIDEIKRYLNDATFKVQKLYLTGTGATISNIELLFKESLPGIDVEILKPFFLPTSSLNVPIKEYIDVNSATALAMEELGFARDTMSFKSGNKKSNVNLNMDLKDIDMSNVGESIKESFTAEISQFESFSIRLGLTSLIILILFIAVSIVLTKSNRVKLIETEQIYSQSRDSLNRIQQDIENVKTKTEDYKALLSKMDGSSNQITTTTSFIQKDALPNFLNQIAHLIPIRAKITEIKEEKSHITLMVESEKYEQLGYFVGILDNERVLLNIKTSTSFKDGNIVKLVIEGDLP